jgi:polyhydroxybutyrate depolymerase
MHRRNWIVTCVVVATAATILGTVGPSYASTIAKPSQRFISAAGPSPGDGGRSAERGCLRVPSGMSVGQTVTQDLTSGGRQRTYLVHLPARYQPRRPTPVVLAFHGAKGTAQDIEEYSGIDSLDAIAVYPQGLVGTDGETHWQGAPNSAGADDVLFVTDLLDRLSSTLCVNQHRIYAVGKSQGGGFTALLACRLSRRIAAFATVAGAFYPETDQGCRSDFPVGVPIVDFHGTGDTIIPYDGGVSHNQPLPPITEWLSRWASRDRCRFRTSADIGADIVHISWRGCADGSAVEEYRVIGGGHTWPGALAKSGPGPVTQTISATTIMWRFFTAHPLDTHDR